MPRGFDWLLTRSHQPGTTSSSPTRLGMFTCSQAGQSAIGTKVSLALLVQETHSGGMQ